ncbi:MAG: nucleotidyltransferase family protein [Acidobacteriota bacterium]
MRIAGILLAAGAGARFGGGKLLAKLADGTAIGRRACANLVAAVPEVIAVVRPGDTELAQELGAAGARVTTCPDAHAGMGASLAHGVRTAGDVDAVMIALADMPWIRPATLEAVAAALRRGAQLVVPRHQGQRGHPVGFGRVHHPALCALGTDAGAREVVARAKSICWLDVDDAGVLRDVDVPADLGPASSV